MEAVIKHFTLKISDKLQFKIIKKKQVVLGNFDGDLKQRKDLIIHGKTVGFIEYNPSTKLKDEDFNDFLEHMKPLLFGDLKDVEKNLMILEKLDEIQQLGKGTFNWIGIYYKASYIADEKNTDLIIGPYIGEVTDHVRIPLEKGLCGMALREERVINEADVQANTEHIACSLKTRSELIVPLLKDGEMVAELDIDSNYLNNFPKEVEELVIAKCKELEQLI